jgi:diguanylate cyclase (GGDEF)-like protein
VNADTAAPEPSRLFRPLAGRLVGMVVALCAGCALLAIAVQGWQAWQDSQRAKSRAVQEIVQSRMPALAAALWDIDTPTVQREVEEIARMPQVDGLRVSTAGGQRFSAGRRTEGPGDVQLAVPHPPPGGTPLGEMHLFFDRSYVNDLLLRALLHMVLGIALLAALTAVLLIRFLRRELTEPLHRIAQHAHGLDPADAHAPPLQLRRPERGWHDDMDLLVEAFNAMQASVRRHVIERDEALRELAVERDALDATVRERTSDLVRLNAFLAHVTQLSAQLIDLPPDRYPPALRATLADLAQQLGADACALAETDEHGRWHWRFVGGRASQLVEGQAVPGVAVLTAPQRDPGLASRDAFEAELSRALARPVRVLGGRAATPGAAGHGAQVLVCVDAQDEAPPGARDDELRLVAEVLFGALARWHGLLDLERTRQKLLQQSRSDPLTGLANRRAFDERKLDELRRTRRRQQPLTVMMVDIDHFKAYNDCYGHAAGDDCLARVGHCLQSLFQRPFDCVARIGGEEFAVLLPDTPLAQAEAQARRVLEAIRRLGIAHAASPIGRVSVSLGATTLERHDNEPLSPVFDRLMRQADEALYQAKAAGRDTVVVQPMA